MDKVLLNLALIELIEFCTSHGLPCAGTRVTKYGRGFSYSLVDQDKGTVVATVKFSKNAVPAFSVPF